MIKNKKGFIAGWMVDVYAILLTCLIVLFFYILFHTVANDRVEKVEGIEKDLSANILANTYLSLPVNYEGVNMTMAEFIAIIDHMDIRSSQYKIADEKLRKITTWFLENLPNYKESHSLTITDNYYIKIQGQKEFNFKPGASSIKLDLENNFFILNCGNNKINLLADTSLVPGFSENIYVIVSNKRCGIR